MTSDHPNTPPQHPLEGPAIAENPLPAVDTHTPEKPRRQQRRKRGPKKPVATTNAANEGDAPVKPAETSPRKPRRRNRHPKAPVDANKETVVAEKQEEKTAEVAQEKTDGEASQQKKRRFFRHRGPKRAPQQPQVNGEEQTTEAVTETNTGEAVEGVKKVQRPRREIPFNRRVFGRYECVDCEHKWTSANSWRGKKQGCKLCSNMVEATELRFLFHRKPRSLTRDDTATPQQGENNQSVQNTTEELKTEEMGDKKTDTDNNVAVEGQEQEDVKPPRLPHPSHLCEMCLSLGHSCRDRLEKKAEETETTEATEAKPEEKTVQDVEKTAEEVEKTVEDVQKKETPINSEEVQPSSA